MWVWMCQHSRLEEFKDSFMAHLTFGFNYPILTILEDVGRWVLLACSVVNRLSTDTPGQSVYDMQVISLSSQRIPFLSWFLCSHMTAQMSSNTTASQCLAEESPPWHKTQQSGTWKLLKMEGGGISDQVEVISRWWIQRSRYQIWK